LGQSVQVGGHLAKPKVEKTGEKEVSLSVKRGVRSGGKGSAQPAPPMKPLFDSEETQGQVGPNS